jgi:hypothetical protein
VAGALVGSLAAIMVDSPATALVDGLVGTGAGVAAGVQALKAMASNNTAMSSFLVFIFLLR